MTPHEGRRRLLRFLLGSPLLTGVGGALEALAQTGPDVITSLDQALNVMDFEAAARRQLSPAHFGFLATGVDDEVTLRQNREGFSRLALRVRRLVNVRDVDMSVSLFGAAWDTPIILAPVSGRATIESLPEVVQGAGGKIPVLVDGGFRRGTDVFKALALGATAVCIGRPYVWGLAAFGQAGVETVLEILRRELLMVMRQAGTPRLANIDRSCVVTRAP